MNAALSSSPNRPAIPHWIARFTAIGMFGFFMLFALADGIPPLAQQPVRVQLEFASLAIIFVGYAIGRRQPMVGGATALLGYGLLNAVELATNHRRAARSGCSRSLRCFIWSPRGERLLQSPAPPGVTHRKTMPTGMTPDPLAEPGAEITKASA